MASGDPAEAGPALVALADRLRHQDQLYTASAPAVMFLVEIAADRSVPAPHRAGCLLLCGTMAGARAADGDSLRRIARSLAGVEPALRSLLADPDASVRAATAALAGRIPGPPTAWEKPLRDLAAAAADETERALYEVAAALAGGRQPSRESIELASRADAGARDWRQREASGLMGLRVSPGAAARLCIILARSITARTIF